MWRDVRLTLAITYVLPEHSTLEVVQRLWQRLTSLGFSRMTLFLDKGFCCGEVLRYLQAQHQPAILACAIRGKAGGSRALFGTPKPSPDLYLHRWYRRRGGDGGHMATRTGWSSPPEMADVCAGGLGVVAPD